MPFSSSLSIRLLVLAWLIAPAMGAAQTTTAPPRFSFPPVIESVTPSTGVTASGARLSARVPGLEPEMLDYYESKMQSTPTPDGGVKYGGSRTARVRVSPTDVIDVPFKETLKADKAVLGKAVAKFAKVLPIVGNVVALAELADFGLDYANGGFQYTPPTQTSTYTGSSVTCQIAKNAGMQPGQDRYFVHTNGVTKVHVILVAEAGKPGSTYPAGYGLTEYCTTTYPNVGGYFPGILQKNVTTIPAQPSQPATDAQVETAVGQAIDRDVSAAIRMAQLAGRKVLEEMTASTPVEFEAAPQSTPVRQESVTQSQNPDGSVDTSTTTVQTTVTPTTSGSTIGNGSMTLNSNTNYTTSTTNNVTNQTTTVTTSVANNGGGAPKANEVEIETCGLPNTPACKIDETGTKTVADAESVFNQGSSGMDGVLQGMKDAAGDLMSEADAKHQDASAHFLSVFNLLPTFGNEVCAPLTFSDGDRTMTIDFCPGYYIAKDVFSIFVSLGFMLSSIFMVASAIRV